MRTPFRFHQDSKAFQSCFNTEFPKAVAVRQKRFFGDKPAASYAHGGRCVSKTTQGDRQETEFKLHSFEHAIPLEEILHGDMGAISRHINTMADGMFASLERAMIELLVQTCDSTGNTVEWSQSQDDPGEAFLRGLDKMEWGVDEAGQPTTPSFVHGPGNPLIPKLVEKQDDPEFGAKCDALKKKKQGEALERERVRKSKFKKKP